MTAAAERRAARRRTPKTFGEHLKGITEQYQIAYIELDRDLAVDKVCDIFTQINSTGHPARRVRPDQRAPQAEGLAAQAHVA